METKSILYDKFWDGQRKRDEEYWNRQFRCKVFVLILMVCIAFIQIIAIAKKEFGRTNHEKPAQESVLESAMSSHKDSSLEHHSVFGGDIPESSRNP